ncbi:MAG: hypothetical protein ACI4DV_05330 [Lachnospiraceae bacterium]
MKKHLSLILILTVFFSVTGCSAQFKPEESAIYITDQGEVRTAVMESFDEYYYDFEELKSNVEDQVRDYCLEKGESCISIENLTEDTETGEIQLWMNYETVEDYTAFNNVCLFQGTVAQAMEQGYLKNVTLLNADGEYAVLQEADSTYHVVITEENVCIQTTGKILYVSDNVSILSRKQAKSFEAGTEHLAYVIYK